jgi:hypothetical protein
VSHARVKSKETDPLTSNRSARSAPARGREADRDGGEVTRDGDAKRHWSISDMNMAASTIALPGNRASEIEGNRRISVTDAARKLEHRQDIRTAEAIAKGPVRFRVPTTSDLKTLFTSGKVPEDVLKDRIRVALQRMQKEGQLKTPDAISDVIQKIFPAPGTFDEAAYEAAVDVSDRSRIYQSVLDAEAKVTAGDKPKLKTVIEDAGTLIDDCVTDDANLKSVFGSKQDVAKGVYKKARKALNKAIAHMDASITTDYNLDDPETGLGGWASFDDQKVHFEASVVKVTDEKDAKITIIHESSHLADASVDDKGYYGTPGFESASEDRKVTNAAHYEEIPRRKLGKSKFTNSDGTFKDFKPGTAATGAPSTFEDRVRDKAGDYLRKAWDKAVDVAGFIREVRKSELAHGTLLSTKRAQVLEVSKLMHLTVHEQPAATASVNQVDVVLAEGVARAMSNILDNAGSQPVPKISDLNLPKMDPAEVPDDPHGPKIRRGPIPPIVTDPRVEQFYMNNAEDLAAQKVIDEALKSFGGIVGNDADDRRLADWLVANYQKEI